MKKHNKLHVFDLDDTLLWSSEPYEEVTLDKQGYVLHHGDSLYLKDAVEFFRNTPARIKCLNINYYKTSTRNYIFIIDGVSEEWIRENVTPAEIEQYHIKLNGRLSPYPYIDEDGPYFKNPSTVGTKGVNHELFDLYKSVSKQAVILTARTDVPGMKETVAERIKFYGGPEPLDIFTQPIGSSLNGIYKGNVIVKLLHTVADEIEFYEDSEHYIKDVLNILEEEGLKEKVTIHVTYTARKPPVIFKIA